MKKTEPSYDQIVKRKEKYVVQGPTFLFLTVLLIIAGGLSISEYKSEVTGYCITAAAAGPLIGAIYSEIMAWYWDRQAKQKQLKETEMETDILKRCVRRG